MTRRFRLVIFLLFAGVAPAHASDTDSGVPEIRAAHDSEWDSFDTLLEGARRAMLSDPGAALERAHVATEFAERAGFSERQTRALAASLLVEADALTRLNRVDDASEKLQRAAAFAARDQSNSGLTADIALSLGQIAESQGDFALAQKSLHRAYAVYGARNDARGQALVLQALAGLYEKARDYSHAIEYQRRAQDLYANDPDLEFAALSGIGFATLQLGRFDEAIVDLRRALALAVSLRSPLQEARALTTLAAAYLKTDRVEEADAAADRALRILGRHPWARFVWSVKAEVAFEQDRLDDAAAALERVFRGIDDLTSTISQYRDAHRVAFEVYNARGEYPLAIEHLQAFKRLDDEGRSLSASANLALNSAHFDFSTQQGEIQRLKIERAQREISLREARVDIQKTIYTGLVLLSVLLVIWVSARNIAARKHRGEMAEANDALRETLDERDREIARRARSEHQLRAAKDYAEHANRAKGQFLANMSHELRTPLNAIIGFSEMIAQEALGPVGNANYKGYAADIGTSGRHLLSILNDILDMARIDAGKMSLNEDDVSLDEIVEDSLAMFEEAISAGKRIRFTPGEGGLIVVRADPRKLRQIVINLVSNAVKFTATDGVIEVILKSGADGADIVVRDNGIGIPADKIAHVLQPFGQVEGAFARSQGGVGLGLPIVRTLAELHGGTFALTSKPDTGTVACVHLPLSRVLSARKREAALAS